ncbi:VOC family protein [Nocardioides caldifontis]|uniref:VOC family protein n=1 Tax=Nocardioides caldifontis TaxID=2588938 RepID=UPI0011E006B7|nr:VOC family protein [Nocardioides caldifontis]
MPLNHVGLTVLDLDHAVRFYAEVCGMELVGGPDTVDASDPVATGRRRTIFGEVWGGMRLAHLLDSTGVGLELFEFPSPEPVPLPPHLEFWRVGVSHLAVTVDDIDHARERLEALGGRTRTPVFPLPGGRRISYCEDPWGNAVELSTHDYPALVAVASPTAVRRSPATAAGQAGTYTAR